MPHRLTPNSTPINGWEVTRGGGPPFQQDQACGDVGRARHKTLLNQLFSQCRSPLRPGSRGSFLSSAVERPGYRPGRFLCDVVRHRGKRHV